MVTANFSGRFPASLNREESLALIRRAFRLVGRTEPMDVSVSLVGDREIRQLNRSFMGKDRPTDVLSFVYPQPNRADSGSRLRGRSGDIVVSVETVRRQAKANRRTVREELALMLVHGSLHLSGLDHDTPVRERRMFALQHEVLLSAGIL